MKRFNAITIFCLVAVIFAMCAHAWNDAEKAEREALEGDKKVIMDIAARFENISNLIGIIERTRRFMIDGVMGYGKTIPEVKEEFVAKHHKAYKTVGKELAELATALDNVGIKDHSVIAELEQLFKKRIEQVESDVNN